MAQDNYGQQSSAPPPYNDPPQAFPGIAYPNVPGVSTYMQQAPPAPLAQPVWGYQPQPQLPPGYQPGYPPPVMYASPPPQQQQQQQVVVIGGQQQHEIHIHHVESFFGQIIMSCFVFWCCNSLFGLIAFILAIVASSTVVDDARGAHNLGKASYGVSTAGIVVTIIIVIIVVSVVVTSANKAYKTYSSCYYIVNSNCFSSRSSVYSSWYCNGYYSGGYCYYD